MTRPDDVLLRLQARCEFSRHVWLDMRNAAGETYRQCARCAMTDWT